MPLVSGMSGETKLGVTRRADGEENIFWTNCNSGPVKPIALMTMKSQEKLMLSNAFSASSDIMAMSRSECLLANSRAKRTFRMLRVADRPGINPDWAVEDCWEDVR